LVGEILGLKKNVKIDSGIFEHNIHDDDGILDINKDRIVINGSETKPINIKDIREAFNKMKLPVKHDLE